MDDAPATPVSLERRVRRHVHGPVHGWFAPCAPGLEPVLADEARALGLEGVEASPGGLSFRGRLADGYRANLWLRTANRVWMRLARGPARAPEDVFRMAREVPWEALLPPGVPVRIVASTARSRLFGGGFLSRPLRDAVGRRLRSLGMEAPPWEDGPEGDAEGEGEADGDGAVQRLLARLEGNRLELSLDASGDHLHRRGFRVKAPGAPLRETLAAGILLAAGYDGTVPLADPMCGSATFGAEAVAIARRLPPGRSRPFLFQRWPSWRPATFDHLRRQALAAALPSPPCPVAARDLDPGVLDLARDHLERAGVAGDVDLAVADFFAAPPPGGPPGLAVLNPPYGMRLDAAGGPARLFARVGLRLREAWPGWSVAVLCPDASAADALGLPGARRVAVAHGGLRAVVVIAAATEVGYTPAR